MGTWVGQMGLFQLILDGALLLCLVFLIVWMRRTPARIEGQRILKSAEDFMAASQELSAEFEKNLNHKRALVNELMSGLDRKTKELARLLDQAEVILERLEKARPQNPDRLEPEPYLSSTRPPKPELGEKEKEVLALYRKGFPVSRIASQLRLPKGEVELILGLHRGS